MSIFGRIGAWFRSLFRNIRRKFKKPEELMDEYILELMENLADVKKDASYVISQEKKQRDQLAELEERIHTNEIYASKAVLADNDTDARRFLVEKNSLEVKRDAFKEKYDQTKKYADQMKELHDQLVDQVEDLRLRRRMINTKIALAEATETVNELHDKMHQASGIKEDFQKMEAQADHRLDHAQAVSELQETEVDSELVKLKAKYGSV